MEGSGSAWAVDAEESVGNEVVGELVVEVEDGGGRWMNSARETKEEKRTGTRTYHWPGSGLWW